MGKPIQPGRGRFNRLGELGWYPLWKGNLGVISSRLMLQAHNFNSARLLSAVRKPRQDFLQGSALSNLIPITVVGHHFSAFASHLQLGDAALPDVEDAADVVDPGLESVVGAGVDSAIQPESLTGSPFTIVNPPLFTS
jgi:hypothetical protein